MNTIIAYIGMDVNKESYSLCTSLCTYLKEENIGEIIIAIKVPNILI